MTLLKGDLLKMIRRLKKETINSQNTDWFYICHKNSQKDPKCCLLTNLYLVLLIKTHTIIFLKASFNVIAGVEVADSVVDR